MQEFWEFPGGKLGGGETAEDALCRELAEELGIAIQAFDHFCSLEHDYPEIRVAIDFFLVRQWQGTPSGIEGQSLQWLKPSELAAELLLPADAPILGALIRNAGAAPRSPSYESLPRTPSTNRSADA